MADSDEDRVYQLKVSVKGYRPEVWRRFLVQENATLKELNDILKNVVGWEGNYKHMFVIEGDQYGDRIVGRHFRNDRDVRLKDVVRKENVRFEYDYFSPDMWQHEVMVEKILPKEKNKLYPVCIEGSCRTPVEHYGREEYSLDQSKAGDTKELMDMSMYMMEDSFDVDEGKPFCIDEINERLKRLRIGSTKVMP
ncbi:hypothetical protein CUJ83_10225 [Methanocella sp. CWC-04]|uniref:Plasmid pRiA4b Orf3-like domain-containing protein n=1 Tax=Methanooceanicella nereidis TaxID=2052831 RepID=A0AAP2RDP6_9EURY|nr:plasmid pRiA4b ORF-3 family protein [Methanocella sp. CWC-04]MCD1295374.1 hypothetical protein [Methanocella sp. CWC-04]